METKHTPGPWWVKASPKNAQERLINAGKEPMLGYENWDGLAVVYGSDDDQENGLIVMEANAKLIAAAPDLLEVLIYVRSVLPNEKWADGTKSMIDAAIKKATE